MLIKLDRIGIQGEIKEIVINTNDILSIEPDGDEETIVTTSKCSFPISKKLYDALCNTILIKDIYDLQNATENDFVAEIEGIQ